MPIINLDSQLRQADDIEDLKAVLKQMLAAINRLADSKYTFSSDILFEGEGVGIVMRRQGGVSSTGDGNYVRLVPTGQGSTSTTWDDLGKEKPGK